MNNQARIYEFFGSLPGLLVLAALAAVIVLVAVLRHLRARRRSPEAAQAAPEPARGLPRWVEAAVAVFLALERRPRPSANPWTPSGERADPWRMAGGQGIKIGVYK
jgi:hypothetical protein